MPEFCPLPGCKFRMAHDRADDDIVMPAFLTPRTKNTDKLYRDMEKASEQRVYAAAEASGADVSEMAGLKITDLRDTKVGEIAAPPVNNIITQTMASSPGNTGFQANGVAFCPGVMAGAYPNAGARTQTAIRERHAIATHHQAVGDNPALETLQPGYRRRA